MTMDLQLKSSCSGCGTTEGLYGSNCKHMTLCAACGKTMAENRSKCYDCGATVTRLIREYNVRASSANDKNYFIGRFMTGLPDFSKKKSAENKWSLKKEALKIRQMTDSLREKYKNRPWHLEDETGQSQFQGHLEGSQSATYYLLMKEKKEFVAIPAGSWYNFNKVAQYKQLTLEEAEEKMKNRKKTADGYQRWMMKAPTAFGEHAKLDEKENNAGGGRGRKKTGDDDDEGPSSDKGEEDEDEEVDRKSRLGLNKKPAYDEDDEEGPRGGDHDEDDYDVEKGDDWEHEEIFTDDDEAVGNDPEEREDLAPEVPAPPEIKQDEEDEDEDNEEGGGLSKSGKELKKLLGRSGGLSDSEADDDDDDDDDMDDEGSVPPATATKQKEPKEEPVDNSPSKPTATGSARGTPTSKSSKGKRKANEETKPSNNVPPKKVKTENEQKPSEKDLNGSTAKTSAPPRATPPPSSNTGSSNAATGPVTAEEITAVLMQRAPLTTQELVGKFKARLRCSEDKKAFAEILKRISKIQKSTNGASYVILRKN
ncbi:transcription initiation factor IIF subunit alpha-like [Vicia villosa]|uniref:transcription initiation factor IIF subunit alpha-like n=1 Tax=Vicia villosa TaxID=3911 RepID=UPI00273C85BA|nr:transcription initiation factor IIF subunit alpha-like [Vicia villosa]